MPLCNQISGSGLRQQLVRFLLPVLPFPEWPTNGVTRCTAFRVWLPSFSVTQLRCIHEIACVSACLCARSVAKSCLTLCDPVDCSPPGSSVHGIFQARILEWIAIAFSRGSSQPRDRTQVSCVSCTDRRILYHWATWEAPCVSGLFLFVLTSNSIWWIYTMCLFIHQFRDIWVVSRFGQSWIKLL